MNMDSKQPPSSPQVRALGEHFETALDRAARAAEPPDYDQLAAYVDGTLDDVHREIVESWLESDPALRAEVAELRELHDAMGQPAATPDSAPPSPASRPAVKSAGASGVLPFERPPARGVTTNRFRTTTVIMGAMAAAMIGAVTWMVVRSARVDDARPDAGAAGSQMARQQGQPGQQAQPEQGPPVQSRDSARAGKAGEANPPADAVEDRVARNSGAPQGAANPRQSGPAGDPSQGTAGGPASTAGRGTAAETVAVRDAGGLIAIDAAGTVTGLSGDAADPAMTRLVADALTKGTLPPGAPTSGLGGRELTLMSRSRQTPVTRLAPLSPIATIVRTTRPVFRWSPHPGARGYVVTIYGPDFDQVMSSPALTETTWTAAAALKQGITYQWQVTADTSEGPVRAPAPPAPDARFRVIDAAAGKTLARDLARAGSSKLLKGLLLAQAGVLDEAEQTFEALRAENPDSKRVADLLVRVRERRLEP